MVSIRVNMDKHEVRMRGHAKFAEKGQDIVCASCSMVISNLAQSLSRYKEALCCDPVIDLDSGIAKVSCKPQEAYEKNIDLIFWHTCNGFEMLASNYPQYVSFSITDRVH